MPSSHHIVSSLNAVSLSSRPISRFVLLEKFVAVELLHQHSTGIRAEFHSFIK